MKKGLAGLLALLLLALSACAPVQPDAPDSEETLQTTTAAPTEATTEAPTETTAPPTESTAAPTETQAAPAEALVTDAAYETFGGREFHIPQINLDGAAEVNQALWATLYDGVVTPIRETWEEYGWEGYEYIRYRWQVNDGILSLVVESSPVDWEWTDYYVYNVSALTGEPVADDAVVASAGVAAEGYAQLVREALGSAYLDGKESYIEQYGRDEFLLQQFERTVSDENVSACLPYRDETGELCVIGAVYSIAGADYYLQEIHLQSYTPNPLLDTYLK